MSADTSVPKQREAGLSEFESWLPDAVLRDAPAGMAFLDTDLRFVWVNPALARMYDRPASAFTRQNVAAVWPAVEAARAEAALRQVLEQGRPATETFVVGAAGPAGAAASVAAPVPAQRTFHWFGVRGTDGELRGAGLIVVAGAGPATEETLRRSEERYRALVQGGAQIIWVASP
ncbi:MAG TPA: PAS domain-containing protein, partial [Trebonia sp.]|nr:PAS domain-containing protein [Trebonia sp.]